MKPSIPKGTRDFSPTEVANRTYIMNTIKTAFETFGFQPIETPSFENSSTLMGKYGEEGDRLIFKILNSGDFIKKGNEIIEDGTYLTKVLNEEFFKVFFNQYLSKGVKLSKKNTEVLNHKLSESDKNYIENFLDSYLIGFKYRVKDLKISNERKAFLNSLLRTQFEILLKYTFDIVSIMHTVGQNLTYWESYLNRLKKDILNSYYSKTLSKQISEKALRYDLTVPFARYVVQHQNDITFPFKRYQVQPVWRADRPQKGRFREFFQCDADVVGSKSLVQEVEFIQLYDTVFTNLSLAGTTIKMNNRKILSGIAEVIGASDKLIDFTVALDKLDKIGKDGVVKEMLSKGITEEAIEKVQPLFDFTGSNLDKLASLESMLSTSEEGLQGVNDLRFVINTIEELGLKTSTLEIDVTLARGLNYYTGAIFEVAAPEGVKMGSIGGGGRYDDLTGIFGLKDVSGVGISFGLDRIYLVLEELGLFKSVDLPKPKVLFLNFNEAETLLKMKAIKTLRDNSIKSELYPDVATSNKQQKKQFKYATNREIEFVVTDIENNKFIVKNNGEQFLLSVEELIEKTK